MLKHSVGAASSSSSANSAAVRHRQSTGAASVRFFSNASFTADPEPTTLGLRGRLDRLLDCLGFGSSGSKVGRARSSTTMGSPAYQPGDVGSVSGLRLHNKEYQEDMMSSNSFSRQRMNQLLYHLHRRCSVYNRMLTLTQTTLEVSYTTLHLATPEYAEQVGRSCGELAMKAESLHDNCQNLLNLHLSLVSFRTNELMNLLTVYSAVFIPITFVCSVYGMNFVNMPELQWENGYFICLGVMGLMVVGVLVWFRRKGFI
jgi:Mg2+ and Co2+ transporter CorA